MSVEPIQNRPEPAKAVSDAERQWMTPRLNRLDLDQAMSNATPTLIGDGPSYS